MPAKESVISKDSKISIGLVVGLVGALFLGAFWIKDELAATNTQLLLMNTKLEAIENSVESKYKYLEGYIDSKLTQVNEEMIENSVDRIYRHEFLNWVELLEAKNKDKIEVPKFRE